MVFSSLVFVFLFIPIFYLSYKFIPRKYKNAWTLLASIVFYVYGALEQPFYIVLILGSVVASYCFGRWIDSSKRKKIALATGLIFHFAWLFLYKYSAFFMENINVAFGMELPFQEYILPLGISFYTFQEASYLIDVYTGKQPCEKRLVNLATYVMMFPQLIAGPIVNYDEVYEQLNRRSFSWVDMNEGLKIFTLGLASKVLLANRIGGLWNQVQAIGFESITTPLAWMGIIAYSLQLYFDFYGYSLMAIGLGRMMSVDLPQNFDVPYYSVSMTEFWRRWHITLGRWFREYVYIPLGGSRRGRIRTILNLLVVWALTGLWHGAEWNFVLWGLALFCLLAVEKMFLKKFLDRHRFIGHCYMALCIPLSWLLFAVTNVEQIGTYLSRLFPFAGQATTAFAGDYIKYGKMYGVTLIIGLILAQPVGRKFYERFKGSWWMNLVLLGLFWGSVYYLYLGLDNPFMYFRF